MAPYLQELFKAQHGLYVDNHCPAGMWATPNAPQHDSVRTSRTQNQLGSLIFFPYSPATGLPIESQTISQMVDRILEMKSGTRLLLLAPIIRGRKGEYRELFKRVQADGYLRVRVDGDIRSLDETITLKKTVKHTIDVVVDRLVVSDTIRARLTDSVETALGLGSGLVIVNVPGEKDRLFSEHFACHDCTISLEEIEPRLFSFNSPYGACPACSGLGTKLEIDPDKVVADPKLSIIEGTIKPWGVPRGTWYTTQVFTVADAFDVDISLPYGKLPKKFRDLILYGSGARTFRYRYRSSSGRAKGEYTAPFEGVIPNLSRRHKQTESQQVRTWIESFMRAVPCHECGGARLKKEALAVTFRDRNINEITTLSVGDALGFFDALALSGREEAIAAGIPKFFM